MKTHSLLFIASGILILTLCSYSYGEDTYAEDMYTHDTPGETSVPRWVGKKAIQFFQNYISPIDGRKCAFYPTCSDYGAQCIEGWGLLKGIVMTSDRLQRCHSCIVPENYPFRKKGRLWDPPDENNFW